jgi:hypothetical protein
MPNAEMQELGKNKQGRAVGRRYVECHVENFFRIIVYDKERQTANKHNECVYKWQ